MICLGYMKYRVHSNMISNFLATVLNAWLPAFKRCAGAERGAEHVEEAGAAREGTGGPSR